MLDTLSAVYDTWYGSTTEQVSAVADLGKDDTARAFSFILGAGPVAFKRQVSALFYPGSDSLGYTAFLNINGDLNYVHYDNKEINFTQDLSLRPLAADQLGAMNFRGFARLHSFAGYFLYHVPSHTQLSAVYAQRLQPFQPNVFIASREDGKTLVIVNRMAKDSSAKFNAIRIIDGH